MSELAVAYSIDFPNGGRIWVPPNHIRPYWVTRRPGRAGPQLSDQEIRRYLGVCHLVRVLDRESRE